MKIIEKEGPDLIFVQEPYEYQNRPIGIEKKYRIFTAGNGKYRAAIVIPNNKIDAMLITQISNEDRVFVAIIHENLKFFAVSMYFDIEDQIKTTFTKIDSILQFAKGERIPIATDSNSRSTTWHDRITKTLQSGRRTRPGNFPVLQETVLGWTISGQMPDTNQNEPQSTYLSREDSLKSNLNRFCEVEAVEQSTMTAE